MNSQGLSDKWVKASVIGTIWAASEIVLGSFLHNLRIPFSGNILTALALIILISFSFVWKEKGLFWRAGVICALMKTISPSAVIFGPMIAIFSESVLLEISVRLIGRNLAGFALGGMLAMSWNLLQKIVNYILFYGWNIVDLYSSLLNYARKQLDISFDIVWLPLIILLISFCVFGFIAAVIGVRTGKRIVRLPVDTETESAGRVKLKSKTADQKYSIAWLLADILLLTGALLLLSFAPAPYWISVIPVIIVVWVLRYKRALRQLSRPGFWLFFIILTMITAFLFGKLQSPGGSWMTGLMIGIQMNFRAALVITGFTVLGTEFYNPVVREFFFRTRLRHLPVALELSFESLPLMIANIPDIKTFVKNPVMVVSKFVTLAEKRFSEMKGSLAPGLRCIVIRGEIGSGKTTLASGLAGKLKDSGVKVSGILTLKRIGPQGVEGYDVMDISSGRKLPFLSLAGSDTSEESDRIGRFIIHKEGLNLGLEVLASAVSESSQVIIIDEAGKLELEGRGWDRVIKNIVDRHKGILVLVVRKQYSENIIQKFNPGSVRIFEAEQAEIPEIYEALNL